MAWAYVKQLSNHEQTSSSEYIIDIHCPTRMVRWVWNKYLLWVRHASLDKYTYWFPKTIHPAGGALSMPQIFILEQECFTGYVSNIYFQ